ncbi:MAG: hypothetical protein WBR26_13815 [Candidatus Acidiferrum sp.]
MLKRGADPRAVDLGRDGTLQQGHGYHNSMATLEAPQNTLKPPERAILDPHFLANADIWPRLMAQTRIDELANRLDLCFVHGNRILRYANDRDKARSP